MSKQIFNSDVVQIKSVKIVDKRHCTDYIWKEERTKNAWPFDKKIGPGFVEYYYENNISEERLEILKKEYDYLIEDNKFYYKPYVEVDMTDNSGYVKRFNSIDECNEYYIREIRDQIKNSFELTV